MTIESGHYTENRDFELRTAALRLAALGGFFMIGLLSLVPGGYRPHIPYFTGQMEHAFAYAVVATVTALSLPRQRPQCLAIAFAAGACLLEIAQLLTADRNPSFADALSGSLGASIGVALAWQISTRIAAAQAHSSAQTS